MKRNGQILRASPTGLGHRRNKKRKTMRGIGKPKREWQPGPLVVEHPVRRARREGELADAIAALDANPMALLKRFQAGEFLAAVRARLASLIPPALRRRPA